MLKENGQWTNVAMFLREVPLFHGKTNFFLNETQGTYFHNRFCVNNGRWIPKGEWNYDNNTRQIRSTAVDKCVTTDGKTLFLESCQTNNTAQKWKWKEIYLG